MALVNLDINSLFQRAFGFNRGQEMDSSQILTPQYLATKDFQIDAVDESEYSKFRQMRLQLGGNILGRPLFMPVAFEVDGELILLPNEPTLQIEMQKIIIKTQIQGTTKEGRVKEFITIDDYEIVLRGIAITENQKKVFPEDQIYKIHELFRKNQAVTIKSGITALLGIDKVVIEGLSFPAMIGVQHAQAYELKMVSDTDWTLSED